MTCIALALAGDVEGKGSTLSKKKLEFCEDSAKDFTTCHKYLVEWRLTK